MGNIIDRGREVFDIEIAGLEQVRDQLDGAFSELVKAACQVLDRGGKMVLSGVGKSGHIGHKIAATLASTGSPAVFMHPVEAIHGDLGILEEGDLLITLSYSGETDELLAALPAAKRLGAKIVAITGEAKSRLAEFSDITVPMVVSREACPFNLAPTTTTTALLALGDALAMVLLAERGFSKEDYGRRHPGGAIGRAVTLQVRDIMRSGDRLVCVTPDSSIKETLMQMTHARSGSAIVTDSECGLIGIFTDGDFRRHINEDIGLLERPVSHAMTKNPTSVHVGDLAVEILKILEHKHIDDIIVLDEREKVVGVVDIQDLPGLKLM